MNFQRTFSDAPWEKQIAYCRAVRMGEHIYVSGTAPVSAGGEIFARNDPYAQAKRCLEIIERALRDLDADRSHIVRTRMFVTNIHLWSEFGRAHHEFFAKNPPATSMIEVKSLIDPEMLIEIEADALCPQ